MRSRPFLSRLLLAGLGMLILCLAGVIGLGWGLRENPRLFVRFLGERRWGDWYCTYLSALATLFPADSDGDGFPDSVERYMKSNPQIAGDHRMLRWVYPERGVTVTDLDREAYLPDGLFQPGERRRVRMRMGVMERQIVFARGWRIRVNRGNNSFVDRPGGTEASDWVLVPVSTDGVVEFDYESTKHAPEEFPDVIVFGPPDRLPLMEGEAGQLQFDIAWREAPLACTVEEIPPGDPIRRRVYERLEGWRKDPMLRLTWQPAGPAEKFYLEATRDEAGQDWFIIGRHPADARSCLVSYKLEGHSRAAHRGPLRFRVIPTKPEPTEH